MLKDALPYLGPLLIALIGWLFTATKSRQEINKLKAEAGKLETDSAISVTKFYKDSLDAMMIENKQLSIENMELKVQNHALLAKLDELERQVNTLHTQVNNLRRQIP